MKKKFTLLLVLEGILCAAYVLLGSALPNLFGTLASFPFCQIGMALRALSLSGGVGNVAAWVLYCAVCLAPAAVLLCRKRGLHWEDWLLLVLSVVLFPGMYLMVNPQMQSEALNQSAMGSVLLGTTVYAILVGYGLLKMLRKCFAAEDLRLMDYLKWLFLAFAALLVLGTFGSGLSGLVEHIAAVREGNRGNENGLEITYAFLCLQYAVEILPNVLCCGILLDACGMLELMRAEGCTGELILAAEKLSRSCGRLLTIVVVSSIGLDLLQLLFIQELRVVATTVRLPLETMAFVVAVLLIARFIRSHKELKDENDCFI